ncbi:hypothetical protein BVH03_21835 [Pseudomonas sp. PA15(2017)]|uniref:hypothetical protein n=1 Tax=Pseudomonas sp. PA15(2017) TaxID=1932111 RepID=UPI000959D6B5|nr:hypothetical protein [Pseudomonas sp. PA15(2017)]OLU22896.1 hypothetical protein BVH03_21835 [Pseudomonas sp. PA15(2017)]
MTINIAVATYDAIVLGCDSLSSVSEQAIFPFRPEVGFARDANGNELVDATGSKVVSAANMRSLVTNVWGGARKMFLLYEDDDTSVAAVTAGIATLSGSTIAELAGRFRRSNEIASLSYSRTADVAEDFRRYMRAEWERAVGFHEIEDEVKPYLDDLQFIIGGHGRDDERGMVLKVSIRDDAQYDQFPAAPHKGTCWGGQSDWVERLLVGVDGQLAHGIGRMFSMHLDAEVSRTAESLLDELDAAGGTIPDDFSFELRPVDFDAPWRVAIGDIDYGNLPTQYAIEFVELLVNTQSGMQRFARGVPTVGGRTNIGVLRRGQKFAMLNEPDLVHKHLGYSHDA